jgi:hypothetical protein
VFLPLHLCRFFSGSATSPLSSLENSKALSMFSNL